MEKQHVFQKIFQQLNFMVFALLLVEQLAQVVMLVQFKLELEQMLKHNFQVKLEKEQLKRELIEQQELIKQLALEKQ